jgi:hypothetical protein
MGIVSRLSPFYLEKASMEEMLKYLLIALFVGGAVPIFISYFSRKHQTRRTKKKENNRNH